MPSIFEKYNLKQVINTSGRMTALGVSTPRPEVVQAAMDGMNQYFEMKDLVNKTGEYPRTTWTSIPFVGWSRR
jgi:L-seryl-tRNA(Ser) seleniumtransferase